MPCISIAVEPFTSQWWAEAKSLAESHFEEVDGGVEPRRRFELDEDIMTAMERAGVIKILVARDNGKIVGYYTWQIATDVESKGLLIAQQGAFYVEPGHPSVAHAMFERSVQELRALGVKCIFPHHRTQGRGDHLGRFFERRGAKKIQETYVMWIGDQAYA